MGWLVSEENFDKSKIELFGSKFCIGNGNFGYRGTLEEYGKEQLCALTLSEIYDDNGCGWREPVNMPNPFHINLSVGGGNISVLGSNVAKHEQSLDIKHGIHSRNTTFVTGSGSRVSVSSERFASMAAPELIAEKYMLSADSDIDIVMNAGPDMDVWDINGPHFNVIRSESSGGNTDNHFLIETIEKKYQVSMCVSYLVQTGCDYKQDGNQYTIHLTKDDSFLLTTYAVITKGIHCADPFAESRAKCECFAGKGFDQVLKEHEAVIEKRWRSYDIEIEGDPYAQLAVRYSIYLLLIAAPFHTEGIAIPARGLSGQVYKGAMFWDAEIYMLQMFLFEEPEIAKNLVMYRVKHLKEALEKAAEFGYEGAFYPWESQETGKDGCTLYNLTDIFTGRKMRTYFRDKQIHISPDVVFGLYKYMEITGDYSILLQGGTEVILECARFLYSYSYFKKSRNRYELLDVTGADEYHERVNNDAYTNYMAKMALKCAVDTRAYMEKNHKAEWDSIVKKLKFEDDLAHIDEMHRLIYTPAPGKDGVIEQFDGYFKEEDLSVRELYSRRIKENEYLGSLCGLAVNTQILKQADVVLMMSLLPDQFTKEEKRANWDYYEKRTEHGSSLSTCIYALLAAEIDEKTYAYDYMMKAATIDLVGNYKLYLGDLYIGGTHPAANGGTWMVTVLGFGGLRVNADGVSFVPDLPDSWNSMSYHFACRGYEADCKLTKTTMTLHLTGQKKSGFLFNIGGKTYELTDDSITVNY